MVGSMIDGSGLQLSLSSVLLSAALQERQEAVARETAKAVDLERQLRSAQRQFAEATAIASQAAEVC